ncbi:polk-1 [Pristionchus pacificus]|uniref:DNA polymerase kappa n=1 Tax=Pristionchus pacificus TaxID=54126 RepID=A0A8R1Z9Y9_PRIPA|nr:polk-1 [Pristionchus pacificus]
MSMIKFSDNKAGMVGLDKDKIQRIIDENSGENFSAFAKKKQERLEKQKNEILSKVQTLSDITKMKYEKEMVQLCGLLEKERNYDRDCVHVDMDAFYAAVEMRDFPQLRNIPMAVGGYSMLSTSNYVARQFGVRAGMPGFIASRLCPQLEIVPLNFDKYTKESRVLSSILSQYDPNLSMGSLDEAYIDLTQYAAIRSSSVRHKRIRYGGDCVCRLPLVKDNDHPGVVQSIEREEVCTKCSHSRKIIEDEVEFGIGRAEIVREMRFRVEQATGLTCSAGIAPNFMLAKVCSDQKKPNDQFELENDPQAVNDFIKELPTRKVSGIGRVAEAHLSALGITKCGDIITLAHLLPCAFSSLGVESMLRIGLGLGSNMHSRDSKDSSRKSISLERTFSPTSDSRFLTQMLYEFCEQLIEQASSKIKSASGLSLKVKLSNFETLTRTTTVPIGCDLLNPSKMFSLAKVVLNNLLAEGKELRLLGVRLYKLIEKREDIEDGRITVVDMLKRRKIEREDENEDEGVKSDEEIENKDMEEEEEVDNIPKCPICGRIMKGLDDREMNMHVDECLNKDSIKHLLISDYEKRDDTFTPAKKDEHNTKQKTILNFFKKSC